MAALPPPRNRPSIVISYNLQHRHVLQAIESLHHKYAEWSIVCVQEAGAGLTIDLNEFKAYNEEIKIYGKPNVHGIYVVIKSHMCDRVIWWRQTVRAVGVLIRLAPDIHVLFISCYFAHSGHSEDEYNEAFDDVRTIESACPARRHLQMVVACDGNVHLARDGYAETASGPKAMIAAWGSRARSLSDFMYARSMVAANLSNQLEAGPSWTLRAHGGVAGPTWHQNDYIFTKPQNIYKVAVHHDITESDHVPVNALLCFRTGRGRGASSSEGYSQSQCATTPSPEGPQRWKAICRKGWRLKNETLDGPILQAELDEGLTGEESIAGLQIGIAKTFQRFEAFGSNTGGRSRWKKLDDEVCDELRDEQTCQPLGSEARRAISKKLYRRRRALRRAQYKRELAEDGLRTGRQDKQQRCRRPDHLENAEREEVYDHEGWSRIIGDCYGKLYRGDREALTRRIQLLRAQARQEWSRGRAPRSITTGILLGAMHNFKNDRMVSPGDGLMAEMLEYFTEELVECIRRAFNRYLLHQGPEGKPLSWHYIFVHCIAKTEMPVHPKLWRPITLIPLLQKLLDRCLLALVNADAIGVTSNSWGICCRPSGHGSHPLPN